MPAVSIVLTSYNHQKFLWQAIESALNQSFEDFELLIWDDASSDGSWEIIQSYRDSRIRAFQNEKRQRPVYGINQAISQIASGEFVAIHHSDDVWQRGKLEEQVGFLRSHPAHAASFSKALIIDEDGQPFTDTSHYYYRVFDQPNRSRHAWLNHFFFHGNALCHPSALIRKSFFDKYGLYRRGTTIATDLDLWIRICLQAEIHVSPAKLVKFRVLAGDANSSTTPGSARRARFEFFHLLDHYLQITDFNELAAVFPEARRYQRDEGFDPRFVLGMIAVETGPFPETILFGLNLLLEAIADPVRAENLRQLYGFDLHRFHAMKGNHEIFSDPRALARIMHLEDLLSRARELTTPSTAQTAPPLHASPLRETRPLPEEDPSRGTAGRSESMPWELRPSDSHSQGLGLELADLQAGRGWQLLTALRRIRLWVAPHGSRREQLWYELIGHPSRKGSP